MEQFRKILVSVDMSSPDQPPHSLLRAVKLAKATGAALRVVDVVQQASPFMSKFFHGDAAAENLLVAERERKLSAMCKGLDYPRINTAILRGRPFVELIREVESQSCDLLVRNALGAKESPLFFSSLDMRLMRNCPCPIWIVKPRPVVTFERVLVAVDPFPADESEERLNRKIIDLASSLAEWEHGTLHVVSAWDVEGEAILASKVDSDVIEKYVEELATLGRTNMRRAVAELAKPPLKQHTRYRKGMASEVITQYATEINADVIVIGTLARIGVPALLMGNTAERVLRQVRCAVLTVKPSGFVSPALIDPADNGESNGNT
jgi:nucleotide-binding universal stress UspA family protein